MITINKPNIHMARRIAKARNIYAIFRPNIEYDEATDTILSWNEDILGPQPTQAELDAEYVAVVKDIYTKSLAKARYDHEISGVDYNGKTIPTDRDTQNKVNVLQAYVTVRPSAIVKFKLPSGRFIDLTAAQVNGAAALINDHIEACFTREAEILDLIDAATNKADYDAITPLIENFSY